MPLKAKYGARFLSYLYFFTKMHHIKIHYFFKHFLKLYALPIFTEAIPTKGRKHTLKVISV
jgi:hypothetical protein